MSHKRHHDLSEDSEVRVMQLVENSLPNPERPMLSDALESELEAVESKAAQLMAARENSHFKFSQTYKDLIQEIDLLRKTLRAKYNKKNGTK